MNNKVIDIKKIVRETVKTNWRDVLLCKKSMEKLKKPYEYIDEILNECGYNNIYPKPENIFRSLNFVNIKDIKVVVMGQDPYHTKNYPNGLAFSVNKSVKPLPKSLKNIFFELNREYNIKRIDGCLDDWAKQGVLLLNRILTVKKGEILSHANIGYHDKYFNKNVGNGAWEYITKYIIRIIAKNTKNCVYLLWGRKAEKLVPFIEEYEYSENYKIIITSHPSPHSWKKGDNPFFGSDCFKEVNKHLKENKKKPVTWVSE
jgi:uracil-DNA glycosylase